MPKILLSEACNSSDQAETYCHGSMLTAVFSSTHLQHAKHISHRLHSAVAGLTTNANALVVKIATSAIWWCRGCGSSQCGCHAYIANVHIDWDSARHTALLKLVRKSLGLERGSTSTQAHFSGDNASGELPAEQDMQQERHRQCRNATLLWRRKHACICP